MSVEERYEYMICRPWCKQSNGETTKDVTQMVVEIMHVKVELGLGQGYILLTLILLWEDVTVESSEC